MTPRQPSYHASALGRIWAAVHLHWRAFLARRAAREEAADAAFAPDDHDDHMALLRPRRAALRAAAIGLCGLGGVVLLAGGLLYWRLGNGPLAVDVATPWLTSAIEERFGGGHHVEVGGTQLERDEDGRTALRMRDVVVRDASGAVVASAPKAEVGIDASSLLTGNLQAVRLSLIGATMALRVDPDGQVAVFAGGDKPTLAGTSKPVGAAPVAAAAGADRAPQSPPSPEPAVRITTDGHDVFSALVNWLEGLDALGLDGRDLTEIGLKNGSLVVDDQRSGKKWTFNNINMSLTRPHEGGVALTLTSSGTDGPWSMTATVTPRSDGRRAIEAVVRDVSPKDILLALRWGDGNLEADMPISAILRAELGPDGVIQTAEGRIVTGAGFIGQADDPASRVLIDEARLEWRWDAAKHALAVPIEVLSGANRVRLFAHIDAPKEPNGAWNFTISQGQIALGSSLNRRETPLILDRVAMRGRVDPANRKIEVDHGEISGMTAGVAFSGSIDYSQGEPRLAMGMAGTRMSVSTFERAWPAFIAPEVRNWVIAHVPSGTVQRMEIATNTPIPNLSASGPPIPEDGLSVDIVGTATIRPVDTLPAIRDADVRVRITGRTATVNVDDGTVDLPSGRKLSVTKGVFTVPDTFPKSPPAKATMRVDGPLDAVIELVAMEPLKDAAGVDLDPATTKGMVTAQVALALPLTKELTESAVVYDIDANIANFAAERLVHGQKAEAANLHVDATSQGLNVKGDVKIGTTPATVEYRKPKGGGDAEVRAQTTLDDGARRRLGFDMGGTVTGPIPVKFSGRIAATSDRESRFAVDADLTQAKIADLMPGWTKPAGRATRATFVLIEKPQGRRIDSLVLEGSGALVKGSLDFDADGEIASANLPSFILSDGDKASLKADRGSDGVLKVTLRGDVFDGRGFIKFVTAGSSDARKSQPAYDFALDVKVGTVAGYNGEAMRGFDVKITRRDGHIRSFNLNGRLGRDAPLLGDLRTRNGRPVVYLETADAGALFRFTDMYPRMLGGRMWLAIDPPNVEHKPQEGVFNIQNFVVRGEPALDRIAASNVGGDPGTPGASRGPGVEFSAMRVDFVRRPGRMTIRDGVVAGPSVGGTVEGYLDFARDDVRLRGTFVPAYAFNNMFAQPPIVGMFLGGGRNEGLLGLTYEVSGPPNNMILRVNPMSMIAPGFLRKIFEFRGNDERAFVAPEPTR